MKKAFLLGLLILLSIGAQAQEILTNQSVLDMKGLGFSDEIIITKIQTTQHNFNTTLDALGELKKQGVSDEIIVAIMERTNQLTQMKEENSNATSGIFLKEDGTMRKILPTVFSKNRINALAFSLTNGLANAKVISILNDAHSVNVVHESQPEFYFFFVKKNIDMADAATNWWFANATSPNDFTLAALKTKKKSRELITGKTNLLSGDSMGIDEDQVISFKVKTIDDYSFIVVPESPLPIGEYCFVYKGVLPQEGATNQSVFDFSVQK